jgi:putative oxidoreductase
MLARITRLHFLLVGLLDYLQSPLLFAIRIYWGWQFIESGWGKLHNLDHVTQFFTSLNIPQPHMAAVSCSLVEFVGGILFALGFGSRIVSFVLFINMTVAYWTADREAWGHIFNDPGKFYAADPYTFWFAALLILILGAGSWSLDRLIGMFFAPNGIDS